MMLEYPIVINYTTQMLTHAISSRAERATTSRKYKARRIALAVGLLATSVAPRLQAQSIDTRISESTYGVTTPSFGQTFTAPLGASTLEQFSFFIGPNTEVGGTATFSAFVMAWNGTRATGPVLYNSGPLETPACCAITQTSFNTGGISVAPGSMYVAFINPTVNTLVEGFAAVGDDYADSYADGYFVFNHSCVDAPTSCDWGRSNSMPNLDMEFTAQFAAASTVVPEPGTLMLLAIGLSSLVLLRSRYLKRRV